MPDANGSHAPTVSAPSVRVDRIGCEGEPVVVIENFSPHPDLLVAEAGQARFAAMGEYYPGVRAPVGPAYFEGLAQLLAPVMRDVFGARERLGFDRALYSIATTPPAELGLAQRIPHIDSVENGRIAIIHYLAREPFGGTAFYRHRSTGYETIDPARHRPYLDALKADFAAHGKPAPAYIEGDTPVFEEIARYDALFNRALIYRSSLLHCALLPNHAPLPADALAGRLTVASFLTVR